jgi:hypothetical protein
MTVQLDRKKGCGGSDCFPISDSCRDPYREGGPVVHEQLRHIVAPQHIEKDYLDTRCSYAISECSKDITLVKVVAPMGIYTNLIDPCKASDKVKL